MKQQSIRQFFRWDGLFLVLLMGAALWSRWPLLSIGLWRDDAATVLNSQGNTIAQVLEHVLLYEHSPPGYFVLMHGWMQWFGAGEFSLKFSSMLVSILLIPATYVLGRVVGSRQVGWLAAIMATISQSAIFYSQEVRTYILAALLTCCVGIFYGKLIHQPSWTKRQYLPWTLGLIASLTAMLYLHYAVVPFVVAWLIAAGMMVLLGRIERRQFWNLLMVMAIAGAMFLPWLGTVWHHYSGHLPLTGEDTWRQGLPWSYRRVVMVRNMISTFRLGFPELPKFLWLTVGFIAVRLWVRQQGRSSIDSPTKATPLNNVVIILGLAIALASIMEACLDLGAKYVFLLSPLGWVILCQIAVTPLEYIAAKIAQIRFARPSLITIFLCGTLLLVPGTQSFVVGSNHSKSGIRDVIADVRSGAYRQINNEKSFYLVLPDLLGITAAYYNTPNPEGNLQIQGFPHWDRPELHNPSKHFAAWRNQELVNEALQQIEQRHREGYRYLGLIYSPQVANIFPPSAQRKVDQLVQQLKQRYRTVQTKNYPAVRLRYELPISEMDESLEFHLLDLANPPS